MLDKHLLEMLPLQAPDRERLFFDFDVFVTLILVQRRHNLIERIEISAVAIHYAYTACP